jgi:alpha-galactosidase
MRVEHIGAEAPPGTEVLVDARDPSRLRWSVANTSGSALAVHAVQLVLRVEGADLRMFRNGYQSWSSSGGARVGIDADPSITTGSLLFARSVHHADAAIAAEGELRSELVTVLRDDRGDHALVGFAAGHMHDGTLRVRPAATGATLVAEAFLGGAVLAPGATRGLHDVIVDRGDDGADHVALLDRWATTVGTEQSARIGAPYQVGWCSWYHYFHDVTERDVRANLARASDWLFDVFQVDDGFQSEIGDWLTTNEDFPGGLPKLAADIAAEGQTPGIWLAPFLAHPGSEVATAHPEWIARWTDGERPLIGSVNAGWGGNVWTLDTTLPEVLDHLEATARALVGMGWRYLKLDFTYAPSFDGVFADRSQTPAQRVRAGFDAVRRGAGDDVFLLGCGAPLGHAIGVVDGMRIGPDVAPWWEPHADQWRPPGYADTEPSTLNAWRNTLARSFMHRRLWLNDPDCLMLRTTKTRLPEHAMHTWALAVAASGGMALVSDDLALLDADARALLDEVVAIGREVDAVSARAGPPACPDLLDAATPSRLAGPACELRGDPTAATAELVRRR